MVAELILIPANTNAALEPAKQCAQYVARSLATAGIKVREQITLCQNKAELQKGAYTALGRSNIVMILGGLTKQQNYLSKAVISNGLNLSLEENAVCLDAIRDYCQKTGEPLTKEDLSYAMLPAGSIAFPGQHGKIPGCAITSAKQHIILMPDAQTEAAAMMGKYIIPFLSGSQSQATVTRTVRTYGIGAEQVHALLCELLDTANPAVTVDKQDGEVLVRVSAHAAAGQQAAALCTPVLREVVERLGDAAYGLDVDSLESALVSKLSRKGLDLAVAESGSDGTFIHVLSETSGGTNVLRYRAVVDSGDAIAQKMQLDKRLLNKKGSVSEWAAVAMADAVRKKGGAAIGLGIAANSSDDRNKKQPVGLVYIAVCDANNVYVKKLVVGDGDPMERDLIIDAAVSRALNMVRLFVDYLPRAYPSAVPLDEALRGGFAVTDRESYEPEQVQQREYAPARARDGVRRGGFGGFKLFGGGKAKPSRAKKKRKTKQSKQLNKHRPKNKKSAASKVRNGFIIRKTDGKKTKMKKFIFILAVAVFLGSAGYVGKYYLDSYLALNQARQLYQIFSGSGQAEESNSPEGFPPEYLSNFAGLWEINPDVVAYIDIPGTAVQYPVVQGPDNDFYLRRDFYGKRNEHGIPFMDYRADISRPSDNLTVYGHNMKDGQIFGPILSYQELDFYRDHPIIEFATLYEMAHYKVFAVFITNGLEEQGPLFAYHDFVNARGRDDFEEFIHQVRIRSLLNIPSVDVEPGDQLLTLSTCTYEFNEARFVVMARKVRPNESVAVDVSRAERNRQPLYPDIWYETFGGSKPLGWDSPPIVTTSAMTRPSSSEAEEDVEESSSSAPQPSSAVSSSAPASSTPASSTPPQSSAAPPPSSAPEAPSEPDPPDDDDDEGVYYDDDEDDDEVQPSGGRQVGSDGGINLNLTARFLGISQLEVRPVSDTPFDRVNNHPPVNNGGSIFDSLDFDPRRENHSNSNISGNPFGNHNSGLHSGSATDLRVSSGGQVISGSAQYIVSRIVQVETGSASFHREALKAQAVAAYSFVLYHNNKGQTPNVYLAAESAVTQHVRDAVREVIGQAVYYNGAVAFTPYHATSAGQTTSSQSVWGGNYPYLVPVDSQVDQRATNYKTAWAYSRRNVEDRLYDRLGIVASGSPDSWFQVLSLTDGGYNGRMSVCGETINRNNGAAITGRMLRENVFGLRSASFEVRYDQLGDRFIFTQLGYGHGVGMSQNGANIYAQDGWNYIRILEHYYPGTKIG